VDNTSANANREAQPVTFTLEITTTVAVTCRNPNSFDKTIAVHKAIAIAIRRCHNLSLVTDIAKSLAADHTIGARSVTVDFSGPGPYARPSAHARAP
jgi:hypothetical protein